MEFVSDVVLICRRQLRLDARNPVWLVVNLLQPTLYLAFFGPLLPHVIPVSAQKSAGGAWQVYVPGLLVQLCLFGAAFVGFTVIADWRLGVMERMRVTPISRFALLFGRVLHDVVVLLGQSLVLLAAATVAGLRIPLVAVPVALFFISLLTVSLSSLSYGLGLVVKNESTFAPVLNTTTVMMLLLSGILLPMSLAPGWLNDVSHLTPFRYVVDAVRDVFAGHYTTAPVAEGATVALVLAAASLGLGTYVFRRESS
ncbi:ABC transporter permease [Catenulispora sp. NL8]|uniref:Transport permease protein n=1 Tax=Catenulispora pinistramenti TaxID=2705254 RepID=A0ABS5KP87_9ACTN|nr:ABC transporter permease [Catenulispora pinistramenti]MBS2547873.1 ABC transporter permease [Catenulispora pinistramenti]